MNLNIESADEFKQLADLVLSGKGLVDGSNYDPDRISLDNNCTFIGPGSYNFYVEGKTYCKELCCYSYKLHIVPTKNRRYEIEQEIKDAQKSYRARVKKLQSELDLLAKDCPHEWNYYPDPSGNNDYCYICSICSKEVKRIL